MYILFDFDLRSHDNKQCANLIIWGHASEPTFQVCSLDSATKSFHNPIELPVIE